MQHKLPISAVILVNQDSAQLRTAIASLGFAKEIIVVDTSGNDGLACLQSLPITVVAIKPITDFADSRNQALEFCHQPWVFFLDSDERCLVNQKKLQALLDDPNSKSFAVKRQDVFLAKLIRYGETNQSWPIRLFQKKLGTFYGRVHEEFSSSTPNNQLDPTILSLVHTPHLSVSSFFKKVYWYAELEASTRHTNTARLLLEIFFFPCGKWLYSLVLLAGVLDGFRGLVYATLMSYHSLFVRIYQLETRQTKKKHE
ncbi:glycosyltransferase family 2 protein [Candidatus Woesebacteria bacterium]|nr:glycosyltransferase family 2 protein [Candidatus Woesebacteria bacterium]